MFCSECGTHAREGTRFCGKCGYRLLPDPNAESERESAPIVSPSWQIEEQAPVRPAYDPEVKSGSPERHLASDVREKYISELTEYQDRWIGPVAFLVGYLTLVALFKVGNGEMNGWHFLAGIIVGGITNFALTAVKDTEGSLRYHSDGMLEVLHDKMERKKQFKKLTSRLTYTILIVAALGVFLFHEGVRENLAQSVSKAECVVTAYDAKEDMFINGGQSDYGIAIFGTVKNTGEDGEVSVAVRLTSSEGEFERKQKILLKKREILDVKYQFAELTENATNMQYYIQCSPKPKKQGTN
jgi:hypothetical protein